RVELTLGQQGRQRGPGRNRLDLHSGRRGVRQLGHPPGRVLPAGAVPDRADRQPVPLGQDAPDPHVGGQLVLGHADQAARQPARLRHSAVRRHVDPVVPERTGQEGRDRHERRVRLQADQVGGQRHLGRVELAVPRHPEERLLDRQRQDGQVHALRLDLAPGQPGGPVVGPAGQRQRHAQRHENHYPERGSVPALLPRQAHLARRNTRAPGATDAPSVGPGTRTSPSACRGSTRSALTSTSRPRPPASPLLGAPSTHSPSIRPPGTRPSSTLPPSTLPPRRSQSQPPAGARIPTSSSPSSSRAAGSKVNPPGSSPALATTTHRARRRTGAAPSTRMVKSLAGQPSRGTAAIPYATQPTRRLTHGHAAPTTAASSPIPAIAANTIPAPPSGPAPPYARAPASSSAPPSGRMPGPPTPATRPRSIGWSRPPNATSSARTACLGTPSARATRFAVPSGTIASRSEEHT